MRDTDLVSAITGNTGDSGWKDMIPQVHSGCRQHLSAASLMRRQKRSRGCGRRRPRCGMGGGTEMIVPYANFRGIITWCKMQMIGGILTLCLTTVPTAGQRWTEVLTMPACKACGEWFAKTNPHEELCFKCEYSLHRLSSYVARVVRCKDCIHCTHTTDRDDSGLFCGGWHRVQPDDFCSYGKKKND